MNKTKAIQLKPGDKRFRNAVAIAHEEGRHGPEDAPLDVLAYWATLCGDCNARHYYEFGPGRVLIGAA